MMSIDKAEYHPIVGQASPTSCTSTVRRLKKGPADYKSILSGTKKYNDDTFYGPNALFTPEYDTDKWSASTSRYTTKWKRIS